MATISIWKIFVRVVIQLQSVKTLISLPVSVIIQNNSIQHASEKLVGAKNIPKNTNSLSKGCHPEYRAIVPLS